KAQLHPLSSNRTPQKILVLHIHVANSFANSRACFKEISQHFQTNAHHPHFMNSPHEGDNNSAPMNISPLL
ncbi:hypothetical protein, partial [Bartonella sp. CL29QHWL]|uniref:hypothetical protein n=1 Tax=Bartonella sp. CL29QHWL TaxID=3243522 RepID=UPI0035D0E01B